ncbi:10797_t:CDS:10 [Scutellospora calospora]|uniref:10797_t:CDS:1 n=1 Tax=Scutellospora calospora TaxID=85575 RepID=A0ACA9JWX5_9GLOM|nr:10797_t:CDS:10 [Scutellospora calospora]
MIFGKSKTPPRPSSNLEVPEPNVNIFSSLTFWWVNGIMRLGYKRPLEKDDLYVLNDARLARQLTDEFEVEWQKEMQKIKLGKKPSLLKVLNRVLWAKFWLGGFYRWFSDTLQVTSLLFLKALLNFVTQAYYANIQNDEQPPTYFGYILIVIMFLMQMGATIFQNQFFYHSMETGFLSHTILINAIYQKALVISGKARSLFTAGKITNLMSTDTTRIDFACGYFHILWAAPIQICIALSLLILNIGPSALAGFALLVVVSPLQGKFVSLLASTRVKAAGITDERVKLTQEVLLGIRVIKYYAWEDSFWDSLNKLRKKEISLIRFLLIMRATITGFAMVFLVFATILSFITYSLTGGTLEPGIVFSSLALFNILRLPLMFLPMVLASSTDAYVSANRISEFLQADELSILPDIDPNEKSAIRLTDGEFIWEIISNEKAPTPTDEISGTSTTFTPADSPEKLENIQPFSPKSHLCDINFTIPRGTLVAIIGTVGSGKTSLLSALVGEMKRIKGEIIFGGKVGYCPQTAWIQNATLRDNITFGLPFDEEKYKQVIKDCCLEPDLKILPAGDMTEIAVYYDAEIVLLDDPLSAVDAHVGRYLFTNCIQGALAKKTRVLVTHHLHYLPQVDYIICMEDGKIAEQGTYEELIKNGKAFSKLIAEYGETEGLMTKEERQTGAVDNSIYFTYIRNAGGFLLIPLMLFLLIMMQGTNIGNNLWLSFWSNGTFNLSVGFYMGVYCAWGVAQGIFGVLCGVVFSDRGVKAARKLHSDAIKRVLRAPISFFDTTPLGRIINRKDVDTCDSLLSESYRMFADTFAALVGTFILISVVFVWFFIPLVLLIFLYYLAALYYRSSNRELKRLDSVLRSSLYAHFSETLTGLPTIRAYREQQRFLRNNEKSLDIENRAYFLILCIQRWLSVRLDSIANTLVFFASLFAIIFRFSIIPSITGVVLAYALAISGTFNWCIRQFAEVEANMNSVERLVYYSENLELEADNIIPDKRPPSGWPNRGEVHVKDLEIKYGPDSPLVLKGVSFDIIAAEKIGIVGRTGCGKSTLATSFFRFIEATSGSITVDDIDISTIGLKDLRRNLTIIPQDPVLFNGTIRSNLDPFKVHSDLDLWNALCRAHLVTDSATGHPTSEKGEIEDILSDQKNSQQEPITLDSPVKENGANFSQGQQQLIAMARALVRHSKLIIMDEATASIDFKTDYLIQTTIRKEFKDSTVITIAHRLRTVADYDRVMVMDAGNVVEFDAPYLLLQKPDGIFRGMCENSGEFAELMELAKQKYEST